MSSSAGRVAVGAVAGVHHAALQMLCDEVLRARRAVAHDDEIDLQRLDVAHGIEQRLALLEAADLRLHIHDVRRKTLFGKLERDPRTRARLDEEVDHGFTAEGRDFLDFAFGDFLELLRGVEEEGDLLGTQVIQTEQIFSGPFHKATLGSELFRYFHSTS